MEARIYYLHDLIEADGSYNDTLTRDYLDQAVKFEAIDGLMHGRSTQAQHGGDICFIKIVAGFEYTRNDAVLDSLISYIAQRLQAFWFAFFDSGRRITRRTFNS